MTIDGRGITVNPALSVSDTARAVLQALEPMLREYYKGIK
jgi:hypothetical protein